MHGTTYCLIGHHSNDIVAVGRHLQRSARLQVNGWIRAWVCFCIRVKTIKKRFSQGEAGVHPQVNQSNMFFASTPLCRCAQWCRCKKHELKKKCWLIIWHILSFYRIRHVKFYTHTVIRLVGDHCLSPLIGWLPGIIFQTINTIKNPLKPLKPQRQPFDHLDPQGTKNPSVFVFQLLFQ